MEGLGVKMPVYLSEQLDEVLLRIKDKVKKQGIKLGEPLSERQISTFERRNSISLPEAYRRFLREIGNGCRWRSGYQMIRLSAEEYISGAKLPFPFQTEQIWDEAERKREENGTLLLIDVGCGQTFRLIVTGKCRGEVWYQSEMGIQPCCQRQDFLGWFEKWLDCGDGVCYFDEYPY